MKKLLKIATLFFCFAFVRVGFGQTDLPSAVRLSPGAVVQNTIIYEDAVLRPLTEGVEARYSASNGALQGVANVLLTTSPFANGFKTDSMSVVRNAGTLAGLRAADTLDLDCNPRVNGETVDIGAFEYLAHVPPPPALIRLRSDEVVLAFDSTVLSYATDLPCETSTATFYFEARVGNMVSINGQAMPNPGTFAVNAGVAGSAQTLTIVVTNAEGDSSVTYTLELLTPLGNDLLHQVFFSMLEVVNNPALNGGRTFADNGYTWYINDVQQAEQSGILTLPNGLQPGTAYSVWVTDAFTGERYRVCPLVVPMQQPAPLNVYPNPTADEVTVEIPTESIVDGRTIELYSITGTLLRTQSTTGERTAITLQNLPAGRYVIRYNHQSAIIVKQ